MPQRCSTRGSPAGTRIPDVFSTAVHNSPASSPNRRERSSSPGDARTSRSRRRLALGDATSPSLPNDESRARLPRAGGGGRRTRIADLPDGDDSDDRLDLETFLNTLVASDQPILQQMGAFLQAKDKTISALRQQLKTSENNRLT